jgi:ferric-dicitrate binding protein FerR (iron transport regulator)
MKADFSEDDAKFLPEGERFELLSAYIDNQVTSTERKQVEQWLDTDREFKKMYLHLLQLEQSIKNVPIKSVTSTDDMCTKVFAKIDRQRRNRQIRLTLSLGCLAILGLIIYVPRQFSDLHSTDSAFEIKQGESLTIALNHPIIQLPQSPLKQPDSSTTP